MKHSLSQSNKLMLAKLVTIKRKREERLRQKWTQFHKEELATRQEIEQTQLEQKNVLEEIRHQKPPEGAINRQELAFFKMIKHQLFVKYKHLGEHILHLEEKEQGYQLEKQKVHQEKAQAIREQEKLKEVIDDN